MSTGISYLDKVWNPITGCSGKGCKAHCWAKDMVRRFPAIHGVLHGYPAGFQYPQFHANRLYKPFYWKKPRRVGVCFMGDLFDEQVDFNWVHRIWDIMKQYPQHQFFVLTKQPQRMAEMVNRIYQLECLGYADGFWDHVWLGVSITVQEDADRMIPELLRVPGKKWLSIEPCLGRIDLTGYLKPEPVSKENMEAPIGFVVLGCESGRKRRPCPHEWMIAVVRQCKAAGLPVWVKQVDIGKRVSHNPAEWPEELRMSELPE